MQEADDYVRNLDAGVVNVVLYDDGATGELEQAHESVAENCVAQVADVGGFIGIDARVLDENLAGRNFDEWLFVFEYRGGESGAIHMRIDVTSACNFQFGEAFNRANFGGDFFGNLSGCFA